MDLQLTGKVVNILEEKSGQGKNGPWRKRDFILKTKGQYPKQVCITQWGDNIDQQQVQEGDEITASIDIQSREYNGNWYTDVKAWKVEKAQGDVAPPPSAPGLTMDGNQEMDLDDDMPF
ncbi:DUF3127 domain-containing protein [Gracilimonas mengyeensis]|uniref:DUF3127 domain-containing protein n=1 Tax=Gracilimonas mengyeensis TaxID=1302730 RepID=A0A521BHE9_9BACT|nr:DUF3127 domain-containing protein [Gracilimonas mengyeensis]SMO46341.1 protein of unknown function [Gracilimonas mengyeensis]